MGRQSEKEKVQGKRCFWKIAGQRELEDKSKLVDCRLVYKPKDGPVQEEKGLFGNFLRIAHEEYRDKQNRLHKGISVVFWEGDEEHKVSVNIDSTLGRDLCNVILSRKEIAWIDISCYEGKDKNDPNKKYARVGVKINHEEKNLGWAFDYKEVIAPLMVKVHFKGEDQTDATKANNFLLEKWIAHEPILNNYAANLEVNKGRYSSVAGGAPPTGSGRPANEEQSLQDELNNMKDPRTLESNPEFSSTPSSGSSSDDLPF